MKKEEYYVEVKICKGEVELNDRVLSLFGTIHDQIAKKVENALKAKLVIDNGYHRITTIYRWEIFKNRIIEIVVDDDNGNTNDYVLPIECLIDPNWEKKYKDKKEKEKEQKKDELEKQKRQNKRKRD